MKNLWQVIIACIITCFVSGAAAQSAADPNAIDFTAKMDTLRSGYGFFDNITGNLNVQKKNSDNWEDFEIGYNPGINEGLLRFGGPFLFDSLNNPQLSGDPIQYGDFDGDGIGDLIDHDFKFHKGLKSYPYFDSGGGAYLWIHGFPTTFLVGSLDFDGDGVSDLLLEQYSTSSYVSFYKGRNGFGTDSLYQYPDDSLIVPGIISGTVAKFNPQLPDEIVFFAGTSKGRNIGLLHSRVKLSRDTVQWLTDTSIAPDINVQNIYATDITGDGIPDLLVSDGEYVYIFKGGDDFGAYPLTKDRAYYAIPNPRLIDRTGKFLEVDGFGNYMHALGDLSGSGIPYIMIEASLNDNSGVTREYGMIYAGGKALDSLFDGIVVFPDAWSITLDTLHSIDSNGRSAVAIVHNHDKDLGFGDADMLLNRDTEKLPHTTNPNLGVANATLFPSQMGLSTFPSIAQRYVKVHLVAAHSQSGVLSIYDLLGRTVLSRNIEIDPGENIEYFETAGLVDGTYIVRLDNATASTKFIVRK